MTDVPPPRPRVTVFLGLSLDGFVAGPGGDLSWLMPYGTDDPAETGYTALMADVDTLLLGRATFDAVLGFGGPWPFAGKRVVVLTHRALPADPPADVVAESAAGPITTVLERLASEGCRHVYADGGQVARQALAAGVVDRLVLSHVPVTLGTGVPLWGPEVPRQVWHCEGARAFPSGLVQARYGRGPRTTIES